MKKIIHFFFLSLLLCSCQHDYGTYPKERRLMDSYNIEFSSEAGSFEIHSLPDYSHVLFYGIAGSNGRFESASQSEYYFDEDSQTQSRVFSSVPWMTIKAYAGSPNAPDLKDDFTVEVEQNTSGTVRTCMLVFLLPTDEWKQVVTVIQH